MSFLIGGLDEVGRGALAGPLIAVASLFVTDPNPRYWEKQFSPIKGVMDSKKFPNAQRRQEVYHRILRHESLIDFGLGEVSVEEINNIGIDKANQMAFDRAVRQLKHLPGFLLVDGTSPLYGWEIGRQKVVPKADDLYWPVGAASILAKVIRDSYMAELGSDFPAYRWGKNAGYGTKDHTDALRYVGPCPWHRKSFVKSVTRRTHD